MSINHTITINEALNWFELNQETITLEKVTASYRKLAKKFHPDNRGNYKEKLSATENFIVATEAKDILIEAIKSGNLPKKSFAETNNKFSDDVKKNTYTRKKSSDKNDDNKEGKPTKKYEDYLSERKRYDYRNPLPTEKIFNVPILGSLFSVVFIIAMVAFMMVSFLALTPVMLIYPLIKNKINTEKIMDMMTGLPLFFIYYIVSFLGILLVSDADQTKLIWLTSLVWGAISFLALDEIYSLIRYKLVSKKIRNVVAIIDEGALTK